MSRHFQYVKISGDAAHHLSQVLADSIKTRIKSAVDINDAPAAPLTKAYARYKTRTGRRPVRDWNLTGATLQAIAPLAAADGQIRVGFNSDRAAKIAAMNQHLRVAGQRTEMWGVAPSDRANVVKALNEMRSQLVRIA